MRQLRQRGRKRLFFLFYQGEKRRGKKDLQHNLEEGMTDHSRKRNILLRREKKRGKGFNLEKISQDTDITTNYRQEKEEEKRVHPKKKRGKPPAALVKKSLSYQGRSGEKK